MIAPNMFVCVWERQREREREKERACERERKRACENEIEIECETEKATSSNACVTPPSVSPVPHAHMSATPARTTCVASMSVIRFRLPVPCRTHPSATPARTPGAARTTETPVPHAHANPKWSAGIQLLVCTLKWSNDERSANIKLDEIRVAWATFRHNTSVTHRLGRFRSN